MHHFFLLVLILFPLLSQGQEVTTLVELEANGGVSIADNGTLYIAHFGPLPPNPAIGRSIYEVSSDGSAEILADVVLSVGSGNDIDPEGFLYQSNFNSGTIFKIDALNGQVVETILGIPGPVGIAAVGNDTLYVCSCVTNKVMKILPDRSIVDFAIGPSFNCANGITTGPDGYFYTTNFSDGRITKIAPDGSTETLGATPAGNGHLDYRPTDQSLYIASYSGHQIFKMDLEGRVELFAGTGRAQTIDSSDALQSAFIKPNGIRFSPDFCSLYISQDRVLREIKFNDTACVISSERVISQEQEIKIFPNPVSDMLIVEMTLMEKISSVFINDTSGKLSLRSEGDQRQISIKDLVAGNYVVIVHTESGRRFAEKIIIK